MASLLFANATKDLMTYASASFVKSLNKRTDEWELLANYHAKRRSTVHKRLKEREREYFKKPKKMRK